MSAQQIGVAIHTQRQTLTGSVSIPQGIRLSDHLNNGPKSNGDTRDTFITLTDATITPLEGIKGIKRRVKTIYISQRTIQMIRTVENDSARGIGAIDGPKRYPFVRKLPVRVTMHLPDYELSGYLHCTSGQGLTNLLDEVNAFIPCTNTTINDINKGDHWKVDFVAINKNQVTCLQQDE